MTAPAGELQQSTQVLPLSEVEQLKGKVAVLLQQLQSQNPGYESSLHQIHVALQKHEDHVHLLTEEEIGTICAGLSKKTNIVLVSGSAAGGKKKLKDITLNDLMG